jgi:hypothetical protein
MTKAGNANHVGTIRGGMDARYRHAVPTGLLTWTTEVSGGRDAPDPVVTQVHQAEYLHSSRRWGVATQFRWFWQDMSDDRALVAARAPREIDSSILGEVTWYFKNDVGNSNLHWVKLNYEHELAQQRGDADDIWTLQYYHYW